VRDQPLPVASDAVSAGVPLIALPQSLGSDRLLITIGIVATNAASFC
jgi:hypothetical protein